MIGLIITWLVTAVSLFIIAQLSAFTGVEIDSFKKALWSAVVFGLLNALVRPVFALGKCLALANFPILPFL